MAESGTKGGLLRINSQMAGQAVRLSFKDNGPGVPSGMPSDVPGNAGGGLGDILSSVLDSDRDGSVLDDLIGMAGRMLR